MRLCCLALLWRAVILCLTIPAGAQTLSLPSRPTNAPTGTEFIKHIASLDFTNREQEIVSQVCAGNVSDFFRKFCPVTVTNFSAGKTNSATFFAAPEYAARLASGEQPVFIAFDDGSEYVPEAAWAQRFLAGRRVLLRANSQFSQALAARAGRGVALLPSLIARSLGGLVAVPFDESPPPREMWLLMRPDVARLARVRTVADHLVELFHEHRQ